MSQYTAPLKDMCFVIRELAGLSEVTALPGHGEVNAELVDAVLGEAAKFAQEVLDPLNREGDKQGSRLADGKVITPPGFKEAYRKFIDAGWNGLAGAPEFGGQGLPHLIATPVQEIWKSANLAFCLCPMLTSGVLEALKVHASPEQKKTCGCRSSLPASGRGTMNLTEPQAGLGPVGGAHARGARGRPLPHPGHQDLHHLGRARHDREHRAPRSRPHARRAGRREGHLALHRPEVPAERRRHAGRAQRHALRLDRAQARHTREPDLRARLRRPEGRGRLSRGRGEPRPRVHVHDDEPRPALGRRGGRGDRRARLPARARIRENPRAGPRNRAEKRRPRHDHSPSRRAPHADEHARPDGSDARACLFRGGDARQGQAPSGPRGEAPPARRCSTS